MHVDVRMHQKAGTQTTKIKSAKSFVVVHPRKFIPSNIYPLYGKLHRSVHNDCMVDVRHNNVRKVPYSG